MSDTAHFKVFCLENYKSKHSMTGKEALRLFKEYGVLDYLGTFYDELHSYGHQYLVADIDEFIKIRKAAQ